jgi:hypothetical protein
MRRDRRGLGTRGLVRICDGNGSIGMASRLEMSSTSMMMRSGGLARDGRESELLLHKGRERPIGTSRRRGGLRWTGGGGQMTGRLMDGRSGMVRVVRRNECRKTWRRRGGMGVRKRMVVSGRGAGTIVGRRWLAT